MANYRSFFYKSVQRGIAVIFLLASIISCTGKKETETGPKIIPVKVTEITHTENHVSRSYVGTAEGSSAVSISFNGSGNVEKVYVSEGQRVRKGQILAKLNSVSIQNTYEAAKASLKQAQDAYDRMTQLHQKGSLPDIQLIEVETGLEKAKAMEAISKKNLDDCNLEAPIDGYIAQRSIEEGQNALPGAPVFKIVSIHDININVSIPENEIGKVKIGQNATVEIGALNNKKFTGTVDIKGVEANSITHTYKITIKLKNALQEIMPGMVCKVFLSANDEENNESIIIPNKAVQVSPEGEHFVWLAVQNKATRRFIKTGQLANYGVIVEDGLETGELLIVEGYNKVSEGMQLSIVK